MPSIASHFPSDYTDARSRFVAAVTSAGAQHHVIQHPLRGPRGEKLYADVAWSGPPEATRVLVTISATHGAEGYCGSGCQTAWLAEGLHKELPRGVAVLAIHAINPHGFAWTRRVTEDNVDLNRNFLDHAKPHPENQGYIALAEAVTPREWTSASQADSARAFADFKTAHGDDAFRRAIFSGQYGDPHGIFFGGHAPTWSNRVLRAIFVRYLARVPHVAVIDYHTGLGPYGHGELIYGLAADSPEFRRLQSWLDGEVTSTELGTSASVPLNGLNQVGMMETLPRAALSMAALEYGTLSPDEVLLALRADNWLHAHGDLDSAQARDIKRQSREAFYADKADWKDLVWERALQINRAMLRGLADS